MLSILLIAISLSMDAFAVSVTNGLTIKGFSWKHSAIMGLYFGVFQALMPLLGYVLGSAVSGEISAYGPYISFFLLLFIGVKMIVEAVRGGEEEKHETKLNHVQIMIMAIATSLDALAVGISFAFMEGFDLLPSCALIGAVTFVICFVGGLIGGKIPGLSCKKAEILGGTVLVVIGVKLLLEGMGVI